MEKVKCPNCGSEDLLYSKEFHIKNYYVLDKFNNPTKRWFKRDLCKMPGNWNCNECGEIFGGTSDD